MRVDVTDSVVGSLDLDIDAKALAKAGAEKLRQHTTASIEESTDPATGLAKPALKPRSAAKPGRKGGRGYDTGKLAAGLRIRVRGSSLRASAKLSIPSGRHAFVASEALRGVTYLSAEGDAGKALDQGIEEELK